MYTAISRMQFLRGDISNRAMPLRPPWALSEILFTTHCTRCSNCIDVCPTNILRKGRGGFPQIDFSHGECLFCADCVDVCTPAALSRTPGQILWTLKISLDTEACIAFHGVECRTCADPCEARAIRMRPRIGGVALPDIDLSACSGCGACFAPCPAQAIRIKPVQQEDFA